MKILCIGNSFSQDATRYLSRIGKAAGTGIKTVNLYIGGCPLKTHYFNVLEDQPAYAFEFNGENTGIKVSIKTALMSDEWDVVTLQQVSHQAPRYNTYQPYLNELAAYVRKYAPHTKIYMHQTWAYEDGSDRLCKELGYKKSTEMLEDIKAFGSLMYALGIDLFAARANGAEDASGSVEAPAEIVELAKARWEAKKAKDFSKADSLRAEILAKGWTVLDKKDGFDLKRS